ncbi:MAG: hypothetical protein ACRD3B_15360 [Candidatus Sulfotelmatobacter sp.]
MRIGGRGIPYHFERTTSIEFFIHALKKFGDATFSEASDGTPTLVKYACH